MMIVEFECNDCDTIIDLQINWDGELVDSTELAVTCGNCWRSHWLKLQVIETAYGPGLAIYDVD